MRIVHCVVALSLTWSRAQQQEPPKPSVPEDIGQILQAVGYPLERRFVCGASVTLAEHILRMEAKRDRMTFDAKRFGGPLALKEVVGSRRWAASDDEAVLLGLDREARVFMTEQLRGMVASDPELQNSELELQFNAVVFRPEYVATIAEIRELAGNPNDLRHMDLMAEAVVRN